MRHRFRVLVGIVLHLPLALAAAESKRAPDPGLLEFLGTFDERDQGDEWFEFLEGLRAKGLRPGAARHTDAPADDSDDTDDKKTGT